MKFQIRYGLGGGFGGVGEWCDAFSDTYDDAQNEAWEAACECYDGYAGLHGLREVGEIMEEEGLDDEEAWEVYVEEREGWLDYEVREKQAEELD